MRMLHRLRMDRAEEPKSHTLMSPAGTRRSFIERPVIREPQLLRADVTLDRDYKSLRLTRRLSAVFLLAALGAAGSWPAAAVVTPPSTNRVALTWGSLGSGTRYYVQTSTNLLTWIAATNTTATNVNLAFTGDKSRSFRLSASNAPPQMAMLAFDASIPATNVAGYFIYYGGAAGSYTNRVDLGLGTTQGVSNLVAGSTYYFAATAYTPSGLESDYSNETAWKCPLLVKMQRLP